MSLYNLNAGYGRLTAQSNTPASSGKTFYVTGAIGTGAAAQFLYDTLIPDSDGVARVYATITLALAACVTGRGDAIVVAADYTTTPTDTELDSAGTKGVRLVFANLPASAEQIAITANKALPATTTGAIFTVTGLVEITSII